MGEKLITQNPVKSFDQNEALETTESISFKEAVLAAPKKETKTIQPAALETEEIITPAPVSAFTEDAQLKGWEKISLVVFFSSLIGFTCGVVLGVVILNGQLDLRKDDIKDILSIFQSSSS